MRGEAWLTETIHWVNVRARRCDRSLMSKPDETLPDFEKALAELESLVEKLESGESALDQSLADFKRGVELTRRCQAVLDQARQSVEQLLDPEDESSASPFDPDE